jgi:hypothetical protein
MKVGRLNKLRGIYPPEIPPAGSEVVGKTEEGQTLYRRKVKPRDKRPKMENGKQVTRGGNPLTGEPGTPMFRYVPRYPEAEEGEKEVATRHFDWEYFTITRGKHGNNRKTVVDPKVLEAEKKQKATRTRKEQLLERVAQLAADTKMDLDDAAKRILGIAAPPAQEPEPEFVTGMTVVDADGTPEADPDYEAAMDAAESEAVYAGDEG